MPAGIAGPGYRFPARKRRRLLGRLGEPGAERAPRKIAAEPGARVEV